MKFKLKRTSDLWSQEPGEIELNSLEELIALQQKMGELIIGITDSGEAMIEIYDDYRE